MFDGDSVPVEYDELVECGLPIAYGSLPLLQGFPQAEPEQFEDPLVVGAASEKEMVKHQGESRDLVSIPL